MTIHFIYRLLLKLYPHRFYAEYAEEMEAVFAATLQAARQHNRFAWLIVLCREFALFPLEVARQHAYEHSRNRRSPMTLSLKPSRLSFARWLTRIVALFAALFYLDVFRFYLPNNPQVTPLVGAFILAAVSILCAWRWGRIGGITTTVCSLLIALAGIYATYEYEQMMGGAVLWVMLFSGVLWGLPFMIFGLLFLKFDHAAVGVRY